MPSDLVINVRQVSNYPPLGVSDGTENVLVQQSGIGGPYATLSTADLVATALHGGPALGVGVAPPANADGGQIFSGEFVAPADGAIAWNGYTDTSSIWRLLNAGSAATIGWDPAAGFNVAISTAGSAGDALTWVSQLLLSNAGNLTLPYGTLTVARDPAYAMEVATLNYVSNNTVASFNARRGQVQLNQADIYAALCLDSPIASQNYVNQAIQAGLENLLTTCPFVNRWNNRTGSVYLMLADIECVFYQSGQIPMSPTPPANSNDDSIATTKWVSQAFQPDGGTFLPISGGTMQGPLNVTATGAVSSISIQNRWQNLRTPKDWGAVGDGVTDDTAAFQAMFAELATENGGRIYIPGVFFCSGALTVPDSVEIYGNASPFFFLSGGTWYRQAGGSRLILGTGGITLGLANILRNIMVIAQSVPLTAPATLADANALISGMATAGTGITLAGPNCLIDTVQVLGFNYAIFGATDAGASRQHLSNIHVDCTNGIYLANGSDTTHIIGAHIWPYLTTHIGGTALNRAGNGIWVQGILCTTPISHSTVFGWQNCFLCAATQATYTHCWADGTGAANTAGFATTGACQPVAINDCVAVANQFAVHHSVSNGCPLIISASQMNGGGPGGSTPATGMSLCVYAEGNGPVQCINTAMNGGDAAFWLGPNTGSSIIIGNTFDDATGGWGYIWHVDPAVLLNLTKHSNRVINSTRGLTENNPPGPVVVNDQMPQGLNSTPVGASTPSSGAFTNLAASGTITSPAVVATGAGAAYSATNATNAWMTFGSGGYGPPAFGTRSVGTKVILLEDIAASQADWAIGVDANVLWYSVPTTSMSHRFYGGTALAAVLTGTGNLIIYGGLSKAPPATITGTSYAMVATDSTLILNPSGTFTLTLAPASLLPGALLNLKLIAAFAVNSASANVVPLAGGAAGTAIMPASAGQFCLLQSDGANWQIIEAN